MKQIAPLISTFALTMALGFGVYALGGSTSANAGNYGGHTPPPEEDCGCEAPPPPPPPPEEDCGCEGPDDHGHGGKGGSKNWNWNSNKNVNKNHNENTNTNTNTNTNNNNVVVNVNVDSSSNSSASATASASAIANANMANDIANNSGSRSGSTSRSGGSGYGIGNGNGSGGGGGSYYVAAPAPMSMGVLNVVVREEAVAKKPVKAVCVSAKGLEEMARYSTHLRDLSPRDETEVFHCLAGDMLVVTIGRMMGSGGQSFANYEGGYVIECHEGEALRFGTNGLACTPVQSRWSKQDGQSGRGGYAEVFISKSVRNETSASANAGAGMATFSGGVGY